MGLRAIHNGISRINTEVISGHYRLGLLCNGINGKGVEIITSSRNRKNFEGATKIEDLHLIKYEDSDVSRGIHPDSPLFSPKLRRVMLLEVSEKLGKRALSAN